MKLPELLAPAGNFEKMQAAILYGADAVYLAGQRFGMRSAADNFTLDELRAAIEYAHERSVKVYLAVNTMPRNDEYAALRDYFLALRDCMPDALILADVGVLMLAKELLPEVEIHISTQANTVSAAAAIAWHKLGAKRVVLARELTLEEIKEIRANTPKELELEAFVHGAMCISYSGRCLLSNFFTGRDGNRGACAQPCRWNYTATVVEEKRPNEPLYMEEREGETFVMASKDTSMISHVPELIECGIDSFKIEGRMKSAYYAAVTTNAYRMAIDAYGRGDLSAHPEWESELESVSHREYGTGYYYKNSAEDANTVKNMGYIREKAYLATVESYDASTGEALCVQRNKLSVGDSIELLSPGKIGAPFRAEELFDAEHDPVPSVPHPLVRFYIKLPFEAKKGDILRGGKED